MSREAEAIKWWESLKPNEQQAMVMKHYLRMEFMLVSMTPNKIEEMFNKEFPKKD